MNLIERVNATQKTVDQFLDKPFEWGNYDCAILAATHAENLGFETLLSKARKYKTALGAKRALRALGVETMEDLVDAYGFERIAPAATITGDIIGFPGGDEDGDEWTALGIVTDPGERLIGFANGVCMQGPTNIATVAWRVR